MDEIVFNTKVYMPTSRKYSVLMIILNISMIVVLLISLVSVFLIGVNIANISSIIISTVVVFAFRNEIRKGSDYLFCYAKMSFINEELVITYYKYSVNGYFVDDFAKVTILFREITKLEYSDQLVCLRLSGEIKCFPKEGNSVNKSEYLVYIEEEKMKQSISKLEEKANMSLIYVDR